jgi:hypothetical protein
MRSGPESVRIRTIHPEDESVLETVCTLLYIGPRCLIGRKAMERLRVGLPEVASGAVRAVLFFEFEPVDL